MLTAGLRRLAMSALLLLATSAGAAQLPDLENLRQCSDRAWKADVEGWADYSFDRHVLLRDLDRNGDETSRVERLFRLTPADRGFDERLLSENGRAATASEVREFRQKANFTRNYRGAPMLEFANPLGENLLLRPVLRDQEHRLVDRIAIDGIPCYRTVFDARPAPSRGSSEVRLKHAMRGSSCVSIDACHVVSLELETVRPVQQGLARIDRMKVTIRGQPAGDGWVARSVEAAFDFSVLGRHVRRITTYTYSNYRRLRPPR